MFKNIKPKETFYKLNNNNNPNNKIHKSKTIEQINQIDPEKKIPRNLSSITLSKDSTLYKTKNNFLNTLHQSLKHNNKSVISPKRNSFYPKNGRSLSANSINFNPNNNPKNRNSMSKTIGNGGFITALGPDIDKKGDKTIDNNRSYFVRKIANEKKFLSYFDIQRIYLLDKKVYKPNIAFERKVYELKNNNSDEFIMNFNFDNYKIKILRLFQRHVSSPNFEILKKNFDLIKKVWMWKDTAKCHRKKVKIPQSETERELEYNRLKLEREQRIKEKYMSKRDKK